MNLLKMLYVKQNPKPEISKGLYRALAYNDSETEKYVVLWKIEDGKGWDTPISIIDCLHGTDLLKTKEKGISTRYELKFLFFEPKEELKGEKSRKKLYFEFPKYDESSFDAEGADEEGNKYKLFWRICTKAPEWIKREDGTDCTNEDWELVYDENLYEYKKFDRDFRFVITKSVNGLITVVGTEKFLPVALRVMREDFCKNFQKTIKANSHSQAQAQPSNGGTNILYIDDKTGDRIEWNVIDLAPYILN